MSSKKAILLIRISAFILYVALTTKSDEENIRASFDQLTALSTFVVPDHPIDQITNSKASITHFNNPVLFSYLENEYTYTQKELLPKAIKIRAMFSSLETHVDIESIQMISETEARVKSIVDAKGQIQSEKGLFFDQHLVEVYFVKSDQHWLIHKVVHIKNLRDLDDS